MEKNDGKLPLVIMSGGTGSRMNMPDKGLLMIRGETLIGRNLKFLEEVAKPVYLAVTPNTEITEKYYSEKLEIIKTSGSGYSEDLGKVLKRINAYPIMVIPGDIYFSDQEVVNSFIAFAKKSGRGIVSMLIEGLFCGVSIFFSPPDDVKSEEFQSFDVSEKQAYNVNTVEDFFLILNRLKKQKN